MRAIRVNQHGEPRVLQLEDAPRPQPLAGQVLVKVAAAGVNFADVYQRRANSPVPFTPGLEMSGIVEELGQGVAAFKAGDRVASARAQAAYAEYCVVDEDQVIPLPSDVAFEVGAAFPLQGMTAHYLVHDFRRLRPGHAVLVHAAAGGVGLFVVAWAKHMGARVIGTVSTAEKAAIVRAAGADDVILYMERDFAEETTRLTRGEGVDLVIDGVGKSTFVGDLKAVKVRGHIVVFGAASGPADPIPPNALMPRSITLSGGSLRNHIATRDDVLRRSGDTLQGIREGWLRIRIDQTLPLAQAATAHELLEGRRTSGKIVLLP
jgi:NADPH2:quinone reductase